VGRKIIKSYDLYKKLDKVINNFIDSGKNWTFGFTGGEPFIFPNFVDICERFSKHFKIAIDTNLSVDIKDFVKKVPSERVEYLYVSMHVIEREKIPGGMERFFKRVRLLQDMRYNFIINYVMYPPLFERFKRDYDKCLSYGINLKPVPFKGWYKGKEYPKAYIDKQIKVILEYNPEENKIKGIPNYYGRNCNAGKSLVKILENGNITRCVVDKTLLGNIYTGFTLNTEAKPCIKKRCPCFDPKRLVL
jgi:MoaA/NifB/PqqE/SkfB family radical SAM enzyme